MFDIESLFELEEAASQAASKSRQVTLDKWERAPRVGEESPWGKIVRTFRMTDGVMWVVAYQREGFWVDEDVRGRLQGEVVERTHDTQHGWFAAGGDAGAVVHEFPADAVEVLVEYTGMPWNQSVLWARGYLIACARWLAAQESYENQSDTLVKDWVKQFESKTITDVEEPPYDFVAAEVLGGSGDASSSDGGEAATESSSGAAGLAGRSGQVGGSGAAGGRIGSRGDDRDDAGETLGDVSAEGSRPTTGEVLAASGPTVGGPQRGHGAASDDGGGRGLRGRSSENNVQGTGRGVGEGASSTDGQGAGSGDRGVSTARSGSGDQRGAVGRDASSGAELQESSGELGEAYSRELMQSSGPALMSELSSAQGPEYRGSSERTVPESPRERFEWNLHAIRLVKTLDAERRAATVDEQVSLARFTGWGALPEIFDPNASGWKAEAGKQLRAELSKQQWDAAGRNTLNAHYTDTDIAAVMWESVAHAGIGDGAIVLEPGCGTGTFMATAPQGVKMIGVELDPFTARIAHYLHPHHQVRLEGFEKTTVQPHMVDAAIGNVPFGNITLHDPMHNSAQVSIHNHFIVKALAATRPGGLVAVVTSRYTMDAQNHRARVEMAKLGDLVGAVRLPSGAFNAAGTDVSTDILVFRRLEESRPVPNTKELTWLNTSELDDGVHANRVFVDEPERVIGSLGTRNGRFGPELAVTNPQGEDIVSGIRDRLSTQLAGIRVPEREGAGVLTDMDTKPGLFRRIDESEIPVVGAVFDSRRLQGIDPELGRLVRWTGTHFEQVKVAKNRQAETLALVHVRDSLRRLLAAQSDAHSTPERRDVLRMELNNTYDTYVENYGPINRFVAHSKNPTVKQVETWVENAEKAWRKTVGEGLSAEERNDLVPSIAQREAWREEAESELSSRVVRQDHLKVLRGDPTLGQVLGIEVFDEMTQKARKSVLFETDVVGSTKIERHANTPEEAVGISMDELRRIDLDRIGELLGIEPDEAASQIIGAAFIDPTTGEYIVANTYLSGKVRDKLEEARAAAGSDPRFEVNVQALEGVLPKWITADEIDLIPGINVLSEKEYVQFVRDTFGVDAKIEKKVLDGSWVVKGPDRKAYGEDVLSRFAIRGRNPAQLLQSVMNQRPVIVREADPNEEKKTVVNHEQTALAGERCRAITAQFGAWVMNNPQMREQIEARWNNLYNGTVAPRYDELGEQLALPGLSEEFTPHPYQREAVARVLNEPSTLLNHVVGAGKTGTMIMSAMELRRTGQARKPWLVVPNHLVEQVSREATHWYPNAHVLGIPTGLSAAERQVWMARSAGQEWDLVVCPQSVFKLMGVDPARQADYISNQLDDLREARTQAAEADKKSPTVKALNAAIARLETNLNKLFDSKDVGMTWEQTGCDYLMVDEAHHFKNLARASDISDLAHAGSQMAFDLDMKLTVLREFRTDIAKREGTWYEGMVPHVALFATGTPVANSLAELWVMQKYLRPDLLEAQGTGSLREWARAFARSSVQSEPTAGGSWKPKDRVRSFANLPELMGSVQQFMSTVTTQQITAALPTKATGEPSVITREISDNVADYIAQLDFRANNLPSNPAEDNLLTISHEGRMLSIDPRLIGLSPEDDGGKIGLVAEQVARIYRETSEREYTDALGDVEERRGALQLVFLDWGVPGDTGFNLYEALREQVVNNGLAGEKVAFIHEAATDEERAELFAKCRDGRINVLVGSTAKMGTGVNVQKRAVAVHHVDVPWRPADLEQRNGRAFRQGNQNSEVEELRYVSIGSFDQLMWQTQARKAVFHEQIMHGDPHTRTFVQEEDGASFTAAAISAVASGSPLVMERAEVMQEVMRLEALESAFRHTVLRYEGQIVQHQSRNQRARDIIEELEALRPSVNMNEPFITIEGDPCDTYDQGSNAVRKVLRAHRGTLNNGEVDALDVGTLHGKQIVAAGNRHQWRVFAKDAPSIQVAFEPTAEVLAAKNMVLQLHNQLAKIDEKITGFSNEIISREQEIKDLRTAADTQKFEHGDELVKYQTRLAEIDKELNIKDGADEIVEEAGYIWAGEMTRLGETYYTNLANGELRLGDKVSHPDLGNATVIPNPESDDGTPWWLNPESSEYEPQFSGKSVYLVARRINQFTAWETEVLNMSEHDTFKPLHNVKPGEIAIFHYNGDAVKATRNDSGGWEFVDPPIEGVDLSKLTEMRHAKVLVKDALSDEDLRLREKAKEFVDPDFVLVGEKITGVFDTETHEFTVVDPPVVFPGTNSFRMDFINKYVSDSFNSLYAIEPADYQQQWEPFEVSFEELRQGDRVKLKELDRDTMSSEDVVTIVGRSIERRNTEVFYRRDGSGAIETARNKKAAAVTVLGRPIIGLSLIERVEAGIAPLPDGAEIIDSRDLEEGDVFLRDEAGVVEVEKVSHFAPRRFNSLVCGIHTVNLATDLSGYFMPFGQVVRVDLEKISVKEANAFGLQTQPNDASSTPASAVDTSGGHTAPFADMPQQLPPGGTPSMGM